MTKINAAMTGPLGTWINVVMFGVICFFAQNLYHDFNELQRDVRNNMSDDKVQEYRLQVLERIIQNK